MESTEKSDILTGVEVSASALWGIGSTTVKTTGEWGTRKHTGSEQSNVVQTNASQERRETLSASTTISQMYQIFTGYHLGTNRAVFFMLPRPHTTEDKDTINPNLINGPRKLEGIQEVFLVVVMPKDSLGFCVQINLDTAHPEKDPIEGCEHLLVTRRRIQSCATFVPLLATLDIAKTALDSLAWNRTYGIGPGVRSVPLSAGIPTLEASVLDQPASQHRAANRYNSFLHQEVHNAILRSSSNSAQPFRPVWECDPVRRAVSELLRESQTELAQLSNLGYLAEPEARQWSGQGLTRVADLFAPEQASRADVSAAREAIVTRVMSVLRPRPLGG